MNIPLQVHLGELVNEDNFRDVWNEENYGSVYRPQDGYWLCDYTPNDDYPSSWIKFLYSSNDSTMIESKSSPYYYVYQIRTDAKIYTINTYDDFLMLIIKYPLREEDNIYIEFEKVTEEWDGIYLSNDGFEACKIPCQEKIEQYSFFGKNRPSLKSWEIPSFLVTNPNILIFIEEKENDRYIEE